jgi:tagatose-1,6-bisphosphate aldolase
MKRFGWLMAMVLAVALAACGQQTGTAQKAAVSAGKTPVTGKQLTRISQNAAEMLQSYAQQVRDDSVKSAEAQLDRVVQRVERLQAKAEKTGGDVKAKMSVAVKTFGNKKDAARVQLEKVKAAGDQPWEPLKANLDEALSELEQQFDEMLNLLG